MIQEEYFDKATGRAQRDHAATSDRVRSQRSHRRDGLRYIKCQGAAAFHHKFEGHPGTQAMTERTAYERIDTMRLPKDQDNWTGAHAERAYTIAMKLYAKYEARIDFSWPRERQDRLYRPYQLAREEAIEVARATNWDVAKAEALP